jgi:hypothetical protein
MCTEARLIDVVSSGRSLTSLTHSLTTSLTCSLTCSLTVSVSVSVSVIITVSFKLKILELIRITPL